MEGGGMTTRRGFLGALAAGLGLVAVARKVEAEKRWNIGLLADAVPPIGHNHIFRLNGKLVRITAISPSESTIYFAPMKNERLRG